MYRPVDLPANQRNIKHRGKKELLSNNHVDVVDVRYAIRLVRVMECKSQQNLHLLDSTQSETHECNTDSLIV